MARFLCPTEERREAVRRLGAGNPLNGLDFIEVLGGAPPTLEVHFLRPLTITLVPASFTIEGGVRLRNLRVQTITPPATIGVKTLRLTLDSDGDLSPYTLIVAGPGPSDIDSQLNAIEFHFRPECAAGYDCKHEPECAPRQFDIPQIDYLARDYSALRRQLLDRLSLLMPGWRERNPSDMGVMFVELLAYVGDHLAYKQDAIATEAYLSTARLHRSVQRHGRLMDYQVHNGHNARAWIQVRVTSDVAPGVGPALPQGTAFLSEQPNQLWSLPSNWEGLRQAVRNGGLIFELISSVPHLRAAHNELQFHTWTATECCLSAGETRATLDGNYPDLAKGDVLILAEVKGPKTGDPADADPVRRHPVRLINVRANQTDPLTGITITEIAWHPEDALPWPLCIASKDRDHQPITGVSVAWGNIGLVDHGRTIGPPIEPLSPEDLSDVPPVGKYRPQLTAEPLSFATPPLPPPQTGSLPHSARALMQTDPRTALPNIQLTGEFNSLTTNWAPRQHLLARDIGPDTMVFVAEAEPGVGATLRFGDGRDGRQPEPGMRFRARYRIGNGRVGNVSADSIRHVLRTMPEVERVWNPMAGWGGLDPESLDEAKQKIPYAYRIQQRAVMAKDYAAEATKVFGVQRASARMRWTGSWYTVYLVVDPLGGRFTPELENRIRLVLEQKRMACHDLEVIQARLIPLDIELRVCVEQGHFREPVRRAILAQLTGGLQPDGQPGVFHPDRFIMGERFYLSPLIAAVQAIDGVASVTPTRFARQDLPSSQGIHDGYLEPSLSEAFVLANDPNFPDRGRFTVRLEGGL